MGREPLVFGRKYCPRVTGCGASSDLCGPGIFVVAFDEDPVRVLGVRIDVDEPLIRLLLLM